MTISQFCLVDTIVPGPLFSSSGVSLPDFTADPNGPTSIDVGDYDYLHIYGLNVPNSLSLADVVNSTLDINWFISGAYNELLTHNVGSTQLSWGASNITSGVFVAGSMSATIPIHAPFAQFVLHNTGPANGNCQISIWASKQNNRRWAPAGRLTPFDTNLLYPDFGINGIPIAAGATFITQLPFQYVGKVRLWTGPNAVVANNTLICVLQNHDPITNTDLGTLTSFFVPNAVDGSNPERESVWLPGRCTQLKTVNTDTIAHNLIATITPVLY